MLTTRGATANVARRYGQLAVLAQQASRGGIPWVEIGVAGLAWVVLAWWGVGKAR